MIKILYNLLLSSMSLILLSCSKEDVSLFYDEVIGKIFVRVDQIESMNKSIDQIDPSEYAFLNKI